MGASANFSNRLSLLWGQRRAVGERGRLQDGTMAKTLLRNSRFSFARNSPHILRSSEPSSHLRLPRIEVLDSRQGSSAVLDLGMISPSSHEPNVLYCTVLYYTR